MTSIIQGMKKALTRAFVLILAGGMFISACQTGSPPPIADAEPPLTITGTAVTAQTSTAVPAPTAGSQPSSTSAPLEGLASELSESGLDVNPDPPRGSLFNYNTLAYEAPGMDQVEVVNLTYATHDGQPLTLDVYYPPGTTPDQRHPVVVFGMGFRMSQQPLRNEHFYTSWGKLVAAEGMVGIVYDTEQPDQDIQTLVVFLQEHAEALRIDPEQIGFWSSSTNVPTVMSYLMQEGREGFRFSVYYYGLSLTPDHKYFEVLSPNCEARGCLYTELADVSYVDPELPLFVVKAGRDFIPSINEAMDHFIKYVEDAGTNVTTVDYSNGRHGFDTEQKTDESAEVIELTLIFMKHHFGID